MKISIFILKSQIALLINKIINDQTGSLNGFVVYFDGIKTRLAGGVFSGRSEQLIAADRFCREHISFFINRNLNCYGSRRIHLFSVWRVSRFYQINGAAVHYADIDVLRRSSFR